LGSDLAQDLLQFLFMISERSNIITAFNPRILLLAAAGIVDLFYPTFAHNSKPQA
jgi:hypothetical protein